MGADVSEQPNRPSPLTRFRSQHAWLDHLVRAGERYTETHGNHYAAAITYFSVLALVPLLMVAFASVALVLQSNPDLLARLKAEIGKALPAGLDQTLSTVIDQAITSASTVGVIGLSFALVAGLGWMTNFRDALSVQWGHGQQPPTPYLRRLGVDLASLIGLGLAMALSYGLTVRLQRRVRRRDPPVPWARQRRVDHMAARAAGPGGRPGVQLAGLPVGVRPPAARASELA